MDSAVAAAVVAFLTNVRPADTSVCDSSEDRSRPSGSQTSSPSYGPSDRSVPAEPWAQMCWALG